MLVAASLNLKCTAMHTRSVLISIAIAASFFTSCSPGESSGPSEGDKCFITSGESGKWIAAGKTSDALDRWQKLAASRDEVGKSELLLSGRVMRIEQNTRALLVDLGWGNSEVRIESGSHEGEVAFVPYSMLRSDRFAASSSEPAPPASDLKPNGESWRTPGPAKKLDISAAKRHSKDSLKGTWTTLAPLVPSTVRIYEGRDAAFVAMRFEDGSNSERNARLVYTPDGQMCSIVGSDRGEYFLIRSNGTLEVGDKDGAIATVAAASN